MRSSVHVRSASCRASLRRGREGFGRSLVRGPAVGPVSLQARPDAIVQDADDDQYEETGERRVDAVVKHDLAHLTRVLGRGQYLPLRQRGRIAAGVRKEADARIRMKDLLQARRQGADGQPGQW